jgi:hypothetical protein
VVFEKLEDLLLINRPSRLRFPRHRPAPRRNCGILNYCKQARPQGPRDCTGPASLTAVRRACPLGPTQPAPETLASAGQFGRHPGGMVALLR